MLQCIKNILLTLTMTLALPAVAQSDPPARVGRLAHIEHQVDFRVDRNEQAGPATLNWPVSSGAVLETGQRGRAEVWIGSTAYRLADDSQLEFSVIDDAQVDVRLNGGSLAVSILDRDQVEDVVVATPDGNVRFLTPGRYRINVFADNSELSVQAGRATFDDGQRMMPVAAGQRASRWSDGNVQMDGGRAYDGFDQWVANRENATLAGQSRRLVSPRMTGYQDLDAYGDWQTAPDYGSVWYPRVVADDWAPYRDGRWTWVAPWGWTWVDQAPWGFAPFHYGRWAIIGGRWGWVPGRLVARPVYAPALVAWIGNPGWNVGFRSGSAPAVGWFPLAPREVYVPSHRHSPNYVRQINVTHIRDVSVIDRAVRGVPQAPFAHHDLPRAVTVVPANLMREGSVISARQIQHPERQDLRRAPLAGPAPNAEWLAPTPAATGAHNGARHEPPNRPRRELEAARPNAPATSQLLPEAQLRNGDRPIVRQPIPDAPGSQSFEPRREGWRNAPEMRPGIERQARPVDLAPGPVGSRREAALPETRIPAPAPLPEAGRARPADVVPMPGRDVLRRPEVVDPRGRLPEPLSAPLRRDQPMPEARPEGHQIRPVMPPEVQRLERPMQQPRERENPPLVRQPEMPRPTPEVRMSAPPPVREMPQVRVEPPRPVIQSPVPAPAPVPQQRIEPPRQAAPQGGGPAEPRRQHGRDDERGAR